MRARRQRTIRVWVSSGPRVTTVPSLIGQSERTAQMRLAQDGVQVSTRSEIRSADYPTEAVVAQNPATELPRAGSLAARQSRRRGHDIRDARLIGMDGERAAEAMRSRGFRVSIVGTQPLPAFLPAPSSGSSPRRLQGGGGRFDLARGESMSSTPKCASSSRSRPPSCPPTSPPLDGTSAAAERGGADLIHVDVMDGHFVPNITIGPPVVRAIKRIATRPLDVHLMIEEPDRYIEEFIAAGASMISVHVEAVPHLHRSVTHIKKLGAQAPASCSTRQRRQSCSKTSPPTWTSCW